MDAQRKKGIIEICVLAILKRGPSYGYMIMREMEKCIEISESTLYPILKRLEQNGSLRTYREEYNGRMRKYYQLTEEGQRKIDTFPEEWTELMQIYQFIEQQNRQDPAKDEPEAEEDVQKEDVQKEDVQKEQVQKEQVLNEQPENRQDIKGQEEES